MTNFLIYDIILLAVFAIFVAQFLYRNRHKLKRDGPLLLYRTSWGIKLIDKIGKKYKKTLKFLSYVSITIGYLLMAGVIYLVGKIVYLYVAYPSIVRAIKIPPITPIIPYIDRVVPNLGFPSFYFIYWIVILAIIAITHEFAHGIFMRRYNIKINSTGFGFFPFFLPIFLAAFVEQDEKSMMKSSRFHQMAVLSAGTFVNILTAILFFVIMWLFFTSAFVPAGAQFNTYSYSAVGLSSIVMMNGVSLDNSTYDKLIELSKETGFNEIKTSNGNYVMTKEMLVSQEKNSDTGTLILYDDAPAVRTDLKGAIVGVDGIKITNWDDLAQVVLSHSPGDNVTFTTKVGDETTNYDLQLGENPDVSGRAFIGIGYSDNQRSGAVGKVITYLSSYKKSYLHYEPKFEAAEFIYDFLWWLVLISFSVALVNMLPVGIFDGGRFFYLTILAITKSEKKAQKTFSFMTYFFLALLFLLMIFWAKSFF